MTATDAQTRRPRILLVSNMYPSPGDPRFGVFVRRFEEGLEGQGFDIVRVVSFDARTGPLRVFAKYTGLLVRTKWAAITQSFDVVHAHFLFPTGFFALIPAKLRRAPLVVFSHGTDVLMAQRRWPVGWLARLTVRHATLVIVPSRSQGAAVQSAFGDSTPPISVVPSGVDTGLFHPGDKDAVRGSVGFEGDAAQVVFVGALDDNKGLGCEDLIGALSMLPSDDARLTVVGDGPLAERLKSLAAELGVASRVTFEHAAPSARVAELLRAADVVAVVPRKRESLGLIALEARASHTPVVAYNVGGLPEHVVPGVNGELVDPGDRKGLAAAIVTALKRSKSGEYRYDSPPVLDTEAAGALLASVTMELLADR